MGIFGFPSCDDVRNVSADHQAYAAQEICSAHDQCKRRRRWRVARDGSKATSRQGTAVRLHISRVKSHW